MKVYIAIGAWSYEGHDQPIGVYGNLEMAKGAAKVAYDGYDWIDFYEYELDAFSVWPADIPGKRSIEP